MGRFVFLALAAAWCVAVASAAFASAERVEEVWRSPYGTVRGPTQAGVNQSDGSLWLVEGAMVSHRSREGELLGRSQGLCWPYLLAPNPADGSCWVSQARSDGLVHLGPEAKVLSTTPGFGDVETLVASPCDGSVWVEHVTYGSAPGGSDSLYLSHVSASGQELSRLELSYSRTPYAQFIVDAADGSAWALTDTGVTRVGPDGTQLWRAPYPGLGDADPRDQSFWVASRDMSENIVTHLSADGDRLWQSGNLITDPTFGNEYLPCQIHASHVDGSVWIRYDEWWYEGHELLPSVAKVHLTASGEVLPAPDGMLQFFNDLDGSVWVGLRPMEQYSASGEFLRSFSSPASPAAYDQESNTFWARWHPPWEEGGDAELQYLSADGIVLWREPMPSLRLAGQTVDPEDGSVWAVSMGQELIRFSPTGEELERRALPAGLTYSDGSLTVSPFDGTWWVAYGGVTPFLTHLSADGTVLSEPDGVGFWPVINPTDGSVWGTWSNLVENWVDGELHYGWQGFVRHLAADGRLLWTKEYPCRVSGLALAADGSAWAAANYPEGSRLEHLSAAGELLGTPVSPQLVPAYGIGLSPLDGSFSASGSDSDPNDDVYDGWVGRMAADGSVLWKRDGFRAPESILVDPADGSVWVADLGEGYGPFNVGSVVAHFAADGTELWRGEAFSEPWGLTLDPRDGSVWVRDSDNEQIVHLQVALSPFPDVPADFWAFEAIAACAAAGIVQGYWNGYHPEEVVTRDQMAVYIARALALPTGDAAVPTGPAEPTFPDVDAQHWAYRHIEYCSAQGVVEGYPDGHYRPEVAVNRGQMAVYIARSQVTPSGDAAIPDPPDEPTFADVTAENDWAWCHPHVEYCAAEGIVQGYWDGTYHPEREVTRDQMAVYIARAFQLPM